MASTPRASLRKSGPPRTDSGEPALKKVELVVTRKPFSLASRMAATASSKTPSRSTAASWRSRNPSTCTTHEKKCDGVQQRFTSGDGDHGRAALLHRVDHVLHREPLAQNVGRVLDFAAPGARQVA